ncbi:MAG: thiaminase II [Alphaproteobacteria bacterium]|nr:thiaminase II [Alphaproteobacteria bacterium]MCY4320431.1 thiaminase II [Alphaproteobacteria bacterium]
MGLFDRLKDAVSADWRAYIDHPFVRAIGDGSLPEACFRRYLEQDYLFLVHFARAYALAAFKGETLADIRHGAETALAIADTEMRLHVSFCESWGLEEQAMATLPEAPATMAYTRYVLERGLAGDLLDLHVALAPCIVGYAEIGRALDGATEGNPYGAWIEMYAGREYQETAAGAVAQLDELFARRGGSARLPALERIFRDATRLEIDFWRMGLSLNG